MSRKGLKYISFRNRYKKRNTYKSRDVIWNNAPDINKRVRKLIDATKLPYIKKRIICLRSYNSKSKAFARIWGLSKVWQISLKLKPYYIIEVLSERFDVLNDSKKDQVILHELAHIPKNFSGSLLPHIRRGKNNFQKRVENLIKKADKYTGI